MNKKIKFCPKCGTKIEEEGAVFCTFCGYHFPNLGLEKDNLNNISQINNENNKQTLNQDSGRQAYQEANDWFSNYNNMNFQSASLQNKAQANTPNSSWIGSYFTWLKSSIFHPGKTVAPDKWVGLFSELIIIISFTFFASIELGGFNLKSLVEGFIEAILFVILSIAVSYLTYIIFYEKRLDIFEYNNYVCQHASITVPVGILGTLFSVFSKNSDLAAITIGVVVAIFILCNIIIYFHDTTEKARLYFISSLISAVIVYSMALYFIILYWVHLN